MSASGVVMVAVATGAALVTLQPRVLRAATWRATVTPLASIIGSGFLVAGPILSHAAGNWAWLAMLGLCLAGYLFGAAIRYNIAVVEPMLEASPPATVALLEQASELALSFAYFVSVAYYLNLLAAFGLRAAEIIDPVWIRALASAVIAALGVLGATRGLGALENIEATAVGLKLGLIAGLLAALALTMAVALLDGGLVLFQMSHAHGLHEVGILLGLVILVQGFETSRYLGDAYDRATRIRTMRYAQLLSGAIYVAFIALITPYFTDRLPVHGGETSIIDMLAPLGTIVAPLVIVAALASQLSAAVADMNGAGGLLESGTRRRLSMRVGYAVTALVALALTWVADIYEIIVYASKAFVIYYALQSGLAALVAGRIGADRHRGRAALFAGGVGIALAVLLFGIPADGG